MPRHSFKGDRQSISVHQVDRAASVATDPAGGPEDALGGGGLVRRRPQRVHEAKRTQRGLGDPRAVVPAYRRPRRLDHHQRR
jgi:hypothetical protein